MVGVASLIVIASAIFPWWKCIVEHSQVGYIGTIIIYQFGILDALPEAAADITPPHEVFLGLAFIAVTILIMMRSTFLKGMKGQLMLGSAGLAYICYALSAAHLVITPRITELGGTLQGTAEIMIEDYRELVLITTSLENGYYLAYAAGGLAVLLALARGMLIRKSPVMPAEIV
jgi:hypothetical protein